MLVGVLFCRRSEIDLRVGAAFTRFQTLCLAKAFDDLQDKVCLRDGMGVRVVYTWYVSSIHYPLRSIYSDVPGGAHSPVRHNFRSSAGAHASLRRSALLSIEPGRSTDLYQKTSGL